MSRRHLGAYRAENSNDERRTTKDEGWAAVSARLLQPTALRIMPGHLTWRAVWLSSLVRCLSFMGRLPHAPCQPEGFVLQRCVSSEASSLHAVRVIQSASSSRVACHPNTSSSRVACHLKHLAHAHRVSSRAPGHPCPNTTVMSAMDPETRMPSEEILRAHDGCRFFMKG